MDAEQSPLVSSSTHSTSPLLKKTSPLKHVTPIIKKYDCQRQAKNGKSVKLKSQGKVPEEDPNIFNFNPVQDLAAGMDSLDAALRRAEKCIASNREPDIPADFSGDQGLEPSTDDLGDVEEEGIPSSSATLSQQNAVSNRSTHLRNRNRALKKRNQLQKDLENVLPLASPDPGPMSEERSIGFAASYFQKVMARFEGGPDFDKFIQLMEDLDRTHSVTDLYHRVIKLFEGHADLGEEFLLFLYPRQAIQCGKFMEHLALTEMSSFLRKLEVCFAKQPQHLRKVYASWTRLAESPDVSPESMRTTILPLLRGNSYLVESFLGLFPSEQPPECKITDFDSVVCEDIMDSEYSGEEETFERVEIPPENDDPYGGEHCQCCCHDSVDSTFSNRTKHCRACGIKFISGKIFMQTEHGLRPVRIDFLAGPMSSHIKRLKGDHPKLARNRSRRGRISQMASKPEEGKQCTETDDEAPLTKVKSPRQRLKMSKPSCEKPTTPKSLSLNRGGCPRKAGGGKGSLSALPLINDQEPMAVPLPIEEEKPPTLDSSILTNVHQTDEDKNDREDQSPSKNNCFLEKGNNALHMEVDDEIKQEDIPNEISNCDTVQENLGNKLISEREEGSHDVKIEDETPPGIPMDTSDVTETGCNEDNVEKSGTSSNCDTEETQTDDAEGASWTRDEDRIILCTFQSEPDKLKTLAKISAQLPQRTIDEISSRFEVLMSLIQQMQ